jgi:hypothetical protein
MAVDGRKNSHRNGCGDVAGSDLPGVFGRLALFLKGVAEDAIDRSLSVGGGMNDEPVIFFQLGNPILDVSGGVAVGVLVGNSSDRAKKGRAHLGN